MQETFNKLSILMTNKIKVYKRDNYDVNFDVLGVKRDWMDASWDHHAYRCFPVTLANFLGWTFSFNEDITFIWHSHNTQVEILSGHQYANTNRANQSISLNSGLTFESEENVSLLTMPVPNQFIDGIQAFTAILSTSVYKGPLPIVYKVTRPDTIITIPAGTPIGSIMPISLTELELTELELSDKDLPQSYYDELMESGKAFEAVAAQGKWTDRYRDALNHKGEVIGKHEKKRIKLNIFKRSNVDKQP
jgi:hypothetical protein